MEVEYFEFFILFACFLFTAIWMVLFVISAGRIDITAPKSKKQQVVKLRSVTGNAPYPGVYQPDSMGNVDPSRPPLGGSGVQLSNREPHLSQVVPPPPPPPCPRCVREDYVPPMPRRGNS